MMFSSRWTGLGVIAPAITMLAASPVAAQQPAPVVFAIPAGPLPAGLRLLAAQSGEQILYDAELVADLTAPAVQGAFVVDDALRRLLAGSGLVSERTTRGVLIIRRIRQAGVEGEGRGVVTTVEDVVVTGSLIRGVADGASPVVVVSRDEIDRQGHASVAQALAALPQNFGGTGNEEAVQNGADRSSTNGAFSSGVNLRGLGGDATLVLINGRRMAGSGAKGDFADISTIPTSVVDRIEILLDGASALYGSDAVGGVVNIILKREFEGAETRVRLGSVTDGPTSEYGFGQTLGRRWDSGGALISYEYLDREALPASERRQSADSDLRLLGGTDRRLIYSHPGNLVRFDPVAQAYVPTFAIRPGPTGTATTPADFLAGGVNLQNQRLGVNILPRQTRHSLFAAFDQALGDRLTVTGDLRYGLRSYETVAGAANALITVDQRNPNFVSPTGAASHQIAYSFIDDLGNPRLNGESKNIGLSLGADFRLGDDWSIDGYVAYAKAEDDNLYSGQLNTAKLREALGTAADSPLTSFSAARDGYFNPFGDRSVNSAAVLDFIGSGRSQSRFETETTSVNLQADGPVFALPGGDVRLAVGASFRREVFANSASSFTSSLTETIRAPVSASRDVAAVFTELRLPVFSAENRRPGFERLELSLAARFEDYDDVGSTTNPKIGLLWSPVPDVLLRSSWGTSFRAPALREVNDPETASPTILPRGAAQTVTLIQYGGNPELEPEEAKSWTAGVEYRPKARPGVSIGLNWFRTDFDKRIGQPALESILTILTDPALAPFVRFVNPGGDANDRAYVQGLLDQPTTNFATQFPADAYGAVVDARYVNTDRVVVEGVDLTGRYGFSLGANAFQLNASLSKLIGFETRATPTSPAVDVLDRPNFPVGLRGRASGEWSRGPWAASLAWNYVDAYRDLAGRGIDAWLTTDAQVRFEPDLDGGPLRGFAVTFTVQNLLDEDPPFYDAPEGIGYDAANADLLGRFVSFQVTKQW